MVLRICACKPPFFLCTCASSAPFFLRLHLKNLSVKKYLKTGCRPGLQLTDPSSLVCSRCCCCHQHPLFSVSLIFCSHIQLYHPFFTFPPLDQATLRLDIQYSFFLGSTQISPGSVYYARMTLSNVEDDDRWRTCDC